MDFLYYLFNLILQFIAENEVIKKEIALREEKEAARLKAKKQRLLKRSESKDIN